MSDTDRCTLDEGCEMGAGHLGPHTREQRAAREEGIRYHEGLVADAVRRRVGARLDTMPEAHHVPIVYATRSLIRDRDPLDALLDAFAALARENIDLTRAVQRYAENAPPAPIIMRSVDDPDVVGRRVRAQLRAYGITDEEMANAAPTDATPEATYAWLEGRGPCPVPAIG